MREVLKNSHQDLWLEAIKAKFEPAEGVNSWGREEFDQILGKYEVGNHLPAINSGFIAGT